tara:strand:- start:183 stop:665 length:483 start_codon:yes stop_codon:yes gene_type:complete
MALSNATRLSDFGSGIGTQGSVIQVDNSNARLGVGTTAPSTTLDVAGIITARTGFNIGINSVGVAITETVKTLNFVGTGNTFISRSGGTIDISISGGAGGASKIYDSTVFAYQNVVESDITIESPYKVATFYTSPDVTIDIEDDVTLTVDSGCTLLAIDI